MLCRPILGGELVVTNQIESQSDHNRSHTASKVEPDSVNTVLDTGHWTAHA